MDHRKRHKPKTPTTAFLRLKIFELYRDGHNYFEIGQQLTLSPKHVESHLIAYINLHHIDVDQLERDRSTIIALNAHLNHRPLPSSIDSVPKHHCQHDDFVFVDESVDACGYGFKDPSWFSRFTTTLCHIFCFWK